MTQPPLASTTSTRIAPGLEADQLALGVYSALLTDLAELSSEDWKRPTECVGWTVREMVAHLVGAAAGHAAMPTFARQYGWGMRHRKEFGGSSLDAMNQRQIQDQVAHTNDELVPLLVDLAPRAVAGRSKRARYLGWAPVSLEAAGSWYPGMPTKTSMGELCAVVLTRDVWAHRLDLARALGTTPVLDPQLDGRIVADIVADWANQHGQAFQLILTGDAGGTYRVGSADQALTLDALDFARMMAGRRPDGKIPDSPLWATKLLF